MLWLGVKADACCRALPLPPVGRPSWLAWAAAQAAADDQRSSLCGLQTAQALQEELAGQERRGCRPAVQGRLRERTFSGREPEMSPRAPMAVN